MNQLRRHSTRRLVVWVVFKSSKQHVLAVHPQHRYVWGLAGRSDENVHMTNLKETAVEPISASRRISALGS